MWNSNTTYEMKHVARTAAHEAVLRGKLKRQPCEKCGATDKIHKHHEDYTKPLDVKWLCKSCHGRYHAQCLIASNALTPNFYERWINTPVEAKVKEYVAVRRIIVEQTVIVSAESILAVPKILREFDNSGGVEGAVTVVSRKDVAIYLPKRVDVFADSDRVTVD